MNIINSDEVEISVRPVHFHFMKLEYRFMLRGRISYRTSGSPTADDGKQHAHA